jgi:hypothetical protein
VQEAAVKEAMMHKITVVGLAIIIVLVRQKMTKASIRETLREI